MIKLFSWGYWGWGRATPQLVRLVDAVEAARGFEPPVFVDVRLRRGGRAEGFRDGCFEEALGADRYCWMGDLGNLGIADKSLKGIRIKDPTAARDLLDLAFVKTKRRIVFFCACEQPGSPNRPGCHRTVVGGLLLKEARRQRVSVSVQEWPGEQPRIFDLEFSEIRRKERRQKAKRVSFGPRPDLASIGRLGFGSVLRVGSPEDGHAVLMKRVRAGGTGWYAEILDGRIGRYDEAKHLLMAGRRFFEHQGYAARRET